MAVSNQLDALAQKFEGYYGEAKTNNLERYAEAKNLYEQDLADAQGPFGEGLIGQIEGQKKQFVGQSILGATSAGLTGVQGYDQATQGLRFEREFGADARANVADMQANRVSSARQNLAGVIERREDEYPDFSTIANLYERAYASGAGGGQSRITLPPVSKPSSSSGSGSGSNWAMQGLGGGGVSGGGSPSGSTTGSMSPTQHAGLGGSYQPEMAPFTAAEQAEADARVGSNPDAISKFYGIDKWTVNYQKFDNYNDALIASRKYAN